MCLLIIVLGHKKHANDGKFGCFQRQLFHTALAWILEGLKQSMITPEVVQCPDGHYHRTIYTFGPYIGDSPKQVLLANVVQMWCPK